MKPPSLSENLNDIYDQWPIWPIKLSFPDFDLTVICLFPDVVDSRFTGQVDSLPDIVDSIPDFVDIFLKVLTTENTAACKVMD